MPVNQERYALKSSGTCVLDVVQEPVVLLLITWASRTMKAEAGEGVESSALSGAPSPVSSARLPAIPVLFPRCILKWWQL